MGGRGGAPSGRSRRELTSLDRKGFLADAVDRGDELGHALLCRRQHGVAPAIEVESFLEGGQGLVQRQVAAREGLDLRLKGFKGFLKRRFVRYDTSFWSTRT